MIAANDKTMAIDLIHRVAGVIIKVIVGEAMKVSREVEAVARIKVANVVLKEAEAVIVMIISVRRSIKTHVLLSTGKGFQDYNFFKIAVIVNYFFSSRARLLNNSGLCLRAQQVIINH